MRLSWHRMLRCEEGGVSLGARTLSRHGFKLGMCANFSPGKTDDSLCMQPVTWQSGKPWMDRTLSQLALKRHGKEGRAFWLPSQHTHTHQSTHGLLPLPIKSPLQKPWPSPCMLLKLIQNPLLRRSMHRKFSHVNKHSTKRIHKNSAIQRHSIIEACWYAIQQHSAIEAYWSLLQPSACHQTFGCLQHTPTRMHTVANVVTYLIRPFSLNWWLDVRVDRF